MNLGLAVPESLVLPLPQTRAGEIAGARAATALRPYCAAANAVLIGPGMFARPSVHELIAALVSRLGNSTILVLDGAAVISLRDDESLLAPLAGRVVLTPHAGEIAALLGISASAIARHAATRFGATVLLKGAHSWIAQPDGALFRFNGALVGLGTSGSGDTLAGIVAGLAASGAAPCTSALWGAWAHGASGALLAKRVGKVGFLARELLAEVPALLRN